MTRNEPYYDGDLDEVTQDGPIIPSVDPISRGRIWTQPMIQRASVWLPLELDTDGPLGGLLITESEPQLVGADVVKWDRVFAEVPDTLILPESFAHSYQFIDGPKIKELTISTTGLVMWEYFLAADSTTIPLLLAFRYFNLPNGALSITGTPPEANRPPGKTGWIITADSKLERYRGAGNIWCRKTPYVPGISYTEAGP